MNIRLALLAALTLAALAAGGCHKQDDPAEAKGGAGGKKSSPPVPVVLAPVMKQAYAPAITVNGEMRATQSTTLTAEVAGKVVAIAHRIGEKHPKNAGALIRIDPSTYQNSVASAKADLEAAQEALKMLEHGPRPQEIAVQQAAVAAAQARYDQAQDNLKRQQQLFEQGAIAEIALVSARTAVETAQAALQSEQQKLSSLKEGSREEEVAGARARVDQARSSLAAAELQLSRTSIAPPFNAVVSALSVEIGQYVGLGTPLCEVVIDQPAEAWFSMPQEKSAAVKPGSAVEVRCAALPDAVVAGRVISVAPAADAATRQFPVRVAVTDLRLKPGMSVTGRILLATPQPTLVLDMDAALDSKLGLVVYRVVKPAEGAGGAEGKQAALAIETIPVELGERLDGIVVLLKGDLKEGDMLVTRGKEQLIASSKVIPSDETAKDAATGGRDTERGGAQ